MDLRTRPCRRKNVMSKIREFRGGRAAKLITAVTLMVAPAFAALPAQADPTVPGVPTSVVATPGDGTIAISWTAPSSDGGDTITGYTATATDGSSPSTCAWTTGSLTCTISSLTNGTEYTVSVVATNSIGDSDASTAVYATPNVVPGAPTLSSVVPANQSLTATWTAPSNSGTSITSYTATATDGTTTKTCTTTSLSCEISTLVNGTEYSVSVVATNAAGDSADSSPLTGTPRTVPTAPTLDSITPGDGSLVVAWSEPTSDGGSAITAYTISATDGTTTKTCSWTTGTLECTISDLANGTAYTVTATATNAAGTSSASGSGSSTPRTIPGVPSDVSATPGNTTLTVSWSAPISNGGATIDGYTVTATDGTTDFSCTWTSGPLTCDVTDLTNGVAYSVSVAAHNAAGAGSDSTTVSATPRTTPDAPTLGTVTPGNAQLQVEWTAPSDNGGSAITGYTAYATDGTSTKSCTWTSGDLTCTILLLTNGTSYTVTVVATNVAGNSVASDSDTATPITVPGAPAISSLTPGDGTISVAWTAPSGTGGSSITSYTVTATDGTTDYSCTWTSGPLTCDLTDLSNGTSYTVTISATNAAGDSVASSSATSTPRTIPDTLGAPEVTAANASLVVTWTEPTANGGAAVTSYTASATDGTTTYTCTVSVLTCTITGLTNGVSYDVTVVATNVAGDSLPSDATTETPVTVAGAPTNLGVTRVLDTITVTWTAPTATGGSAITDYTVTATPNDDSGDVTCTWTTGDGALSCDLTSVSNTAQYVLSVVATNGAGDSVPSSTVTSNGFSAPGAPTISSITVGNQQLTINISAGTDGGLTITDYVYSLDNGSSSTSFESATAPFVITGLTNGTTYRVSVAATNAIDTGAFSTRVSAVPATVPTAPRWLHGTRGNTTATLMWNPPSSNGGAAISSYLVTDLHGHTCSTSTFTCTVTGLTNGVSYVFYVVASNSRGNSPNSNSNLVIPATVPGVPTIVSMVPGNKTVVVTFTAPTSNGGAALGYYDYSLDGGTTWLSGQYRTKGSVITITGLVNGTSYSVKIRARNTVGPGTGTSATTVIPFTVASAPAIRSIVTTSSTATITFVTPNNGGRSITSYQYSLNSGVTWTNRASGTTATPVVLSGLVSKHFYSVMLRAVTAAGSGYASAPFRFQTK